MRYDPLKKKPKRKLTDEELKLIETYYALDLSQEHISALLGMSDTWFETLMKKTDSLRLVKRLGKAKASLNVKTKFWEKIQAGEMKAIEMWMKSKEGYVTGSKLELSGPNGGPIESVELTKEEMKAKLTALRLANDLTDDE